MTVLKNQLVEKCHEFVNTRLEKLQKAQQNIQQALLSETKSTAGDKHETGRAMLQLEREKIGNQLAAVQKLKEVLLKINIAQTDGPVRMGSLVYTSQFNYFMSISAGALTTDEKEVFAIAPDTPIGKLLLGKKSGDSFEFNQKKIIVLEIH